MATRLDLRTALRRRLEDSGATPLWDDAAANEALAGAVRRYGHRLPREATATVAVAAGTNAAPVANLAIEPERIVRVRDGTGTDVPRRRDLADDPPAAGLAQAWRWWAGTLLLERPATAGTWTIEFLAPPVLPGDDATALDLPDGDEEIVLGLAVAILLDRRAVEDGKRGGRTPTAMLAAAAERLLARRARRARGGWLG